MAISLGSIHYWQPNGNYHIILNIYMFFRHKRLKHRCKFIKLHRKLTLFLFLLFYYFKKYGIISIVFFGGNEMKYNRSELRYKIMTILYQIGLYEKNNIKYDIGSVIKEQLEIDNDFVNEIVNGVVFKKDDIDLLANKYLNKWRIDRLGLTDQAILRMGIYELVYTDTPDLVCINEAIELAKQYSDEKVSKMINGVLDKIYNSRLNNE